MVRESPSPTVFLSAYSALGFQERATTPRFYMGAGDQTQFLMSVWHVFHVLGHLPSSMLLVFEAYFHPINSTEYPVLWLAFEMFSMGLCV